MKPHIAFRDETPQKLTIQVNAITSAGISQWSQPYVYDAIRGRFDGRFIVDPAVTIEGVSPSDETAIVHVNVTSPGSLLCSVYAPNRRPVFSRQEVTSAGATGVMAGELAASTEYSVECSLHVDGMTATSQKMRFATIAPVAQDVTIVDVEPFASFAKVALRSGVSGEARCLAQEWRNGAISARSFDRLASRFMVGKRGAFHRQMEAGKTHTWIAPKLRHGRNYRLRCMMEREVQRLLHRGYSAGRRLSESATEVEFATLSAPVAQKPKVVAYSPETATSVQEGVSVTLTFDMPITAGTGVVFVGASPGEKTAGKSHVATMSIPAELEVSGVLAQFRIPAVEGERIYLYIPAGAVVSTEAATPCEEVRFAPSTYWLVAVAQLAQCELLTPTVRENGGILRFECNAPATVSSQCGLMAGTMQIPAGDLQVAGTTVATRLRGNWSVGGSFIVRFTDCELEGSGTVRVVGGSGTQGVSSRGRFTAGGVG